MMMQIVEGVLIPLLIILTKYFVDYLSAKRDEAKEKTNSAISKKYMDMIYDTITNCVIATNQTYVNSLKQSGSFDVEAQKEAFNQTMTAVLAILSEEAKAYIIETTGDLSTYLTQLIEAEVNKRRS